MKYKAKMQSRDLLGLCNAECEEAKDVEGQISTQQKQRMLKDVRVQRFRCQGSNPSASASTF